jgi:heat shock protein HtpX
MWYNQLKTVILLGSLSGLLMLLGGYIGGMQGITIALILAVVMNIISYYYSDKIVLHMYNAQPLDQQEYNWIYEIVRELARKSQLPMPKLWLINTPMANAFATGRNPEHASVAVTTGILDILTKQELRGVLAHELSHVKNRDILVSTVAATLATAIGYIANMLRYASFMQSDDSERRRGSNVLVLFLLAILMPIAASLIQLAISRSREYLADETGAETCHDPLALASALEKLQTNTARHHLSNQDTARAATAHLFIVNPFTVQGLMALFSTHPPVTQRIARLRHIFENMKNN